MDEVIAHAKTLHVLVHGLWFGQNLDQGAERLLLLGSQPPFDNGKDPTVLFRMASAQRRLGRFDQALTAIDRAWTFYLPAMPWCTPTWSVSAC
ncbi:hypothetical protein ACFZCG_21895 [Streptomyces tanashiensis]|uniref:hypothetical protein n=1 Tax=Streptomyces tanashiensis TaxID=67367 RepID=UPI0036E3CDA2